jgi:hypothetical protein
MPAPAEIAQLVELFERNRDQYRDPAFSETAVRHQFIDPFFIALGWDVNNTQGFAEQYKEVIHEDKVRVAGAAKAPDYAFRIGKERKFFVCRSRPAATDKASARALRALHQPSRLRDPNTHAIHAPSRCSGGSRAGTGRSMRWCTSCMG